MVMHQSWSRFILLPIFLTCCLRIRIKTVVFQGVHILWLVGLTFVLGWPHMGSTGVLA